MKLEKINASFSVLKVSSVEHIDLTGDFVFVSKTDNEVSLVCETKYSPHNATHSEQGWIMLRICGTLEFSMVGVIAAISNILASISVPIFVISTYDTDYVLLKEVYYDKALSVLTKNGYIII